MTFRDLLMKYILDVTCNYKACKSDLNRYWLLLKYLYSLFDFEIP